VPLTGFVLAGFGLDRAYRRNVILPALPRRAGSVSSLSAMRTPKPGTRVSNTSTR
jgi:hypothetical protein